MVSILTAPHSLPLHLSSYNDSHDRHCHHRRRRRHRIHRPTNTRRRSRRLDDGTQQRPRLLHRPPRLLPSHGRNGPTLRLSKIPHRHQHQHVLFIHGRRHRHLLLRWRTRRFPRPQFRGTSIRQTLLRNRNPHHRRRRSHRRSIGV